MSKFWDLLKRTQAIGKQVNLRLAIVAVVLGVGGFAVYKGVQQLGPSKPTAKKVVKNGEENSPGTPEAGAPEAGAPGSVEGQLISAEGPLYGGGAVTEENAAAQYGTGTESPTNAAVYGAGENSSEPIVQDVPGEAPSSAPNRLRTPTRPGGSGGYALSDENQGAKQPAVSEDNSPAAEGALVQEVVDPPEDEEALHELEADARACRVVAVRGVVERGVHEFGEGERAASTDPRDEGVAKVRHARA